MAEPAPAAAGWRRPEVLLLLMAAAMPLAFGTWQVLLNNFAIERAQFSGAEIGLLQSLREVPGFLSFAVVFVLLLMREQTLALVSLLLLGAGVAVTGLFPSLTGLLVTTFVMSVGFHYYETVRNSLTLQWIDKGRSAAFMGRMIGVGSAASLAIYGISWLLLQGAGVPMEWVFALGGGLTVLLAAGAWLAFPQFKQPVEQHKKLILRSRYWLYYAITFLAGARRQIFTVFAGFLLVERFGFDAAAISLIFLANMALNVIIAPLIGRWVGLWGDRRALTVEYAGLVCVFTAYAFVDSAWLAVGLYLLDHVFFAMSIAIRTYFQKIADPADIAPTAGVAFTINHIAAVALPLPLGLLWLTAPGAVFLIGAGLAVLSLLLVRLIPDAPEPGNEVLRPWRMARQPA
ncbi:MAG TPA: MFS transporter [Gammaproteobacteria bacterium]